MSDDRDDAPPSEEELAASKRLRDALEDPSIEDPDADLARSLRAAFEPAPIDASAHAQIVDDVPTAEELELAAELRDALDADPVVQALAAAWRPKEINSIEHRQIVAKVLPPAAKQSGERVWRLDLTDSPVLELNKRIESIGEAARSSGGFLGLLYPEVLRRILHEVVVNEAHTDPHADDDDWKTLWLRFACSVPGVEAPPNEAAPDARDRRADWVDRTVEAFCRARDARSHRSKIIALKHTSEIRRTRPAERGGNFLTRANTVIERLFEQCHGTEVSIREVNRAMGFRGIDARIAPDEIRLRANHRVAPAHDVDAIGQCANLAVCTRQVG